MPAPANKQHIAWAAVIGGLIVAVLGSVVTNFVILPMRDRMRERSQLTQDVHDLKGQVARLEDWQKDMQRWKERVIAATGTTARMREFSTMPAARPDTAGQ